MPPVYFPPPEYLSSLLHCEECSLPPPPTDEILLNRVTWHPEVSCRTVNSLFHRNPWEWPKWLQLKLPGTFRAPCAQGSTRVCSMTDVHLHCDLANPVQKWAWAGNQNPESIATSTSSGFVVLTAMAMSNTWSFDMEEISICGFYSIFADPTGTLSQLPAMTTKNVSRPYQMLPGVESHHSNSQNEHQDKSISPKGTDVFISEAATVTPATRHSPKELCVQQALNEFPVLLPCDC